MNLIQDVDEMKEECEEYIQKTVHKINEMVKQTDSLMDNIYKKVKEGKFHEQQCKYRF